MHRNRWSTLYLLSWVLLGSACGNREHRVVGPRAGSGPKFDFADNPGAAGSMPTPPPDPPETLPISCQGRWKGLCETVPMAGDTYSECLNVVLPPGQPPESDRRSVSCRVIWRVVPPPGVPFSCAQLRFAGDVGLDPPGSGTVTCNIDQVAVTHGRPELGEGFYWMDGAQVDPPCTDTPAPHGRIMYTPGAKPVVPGSSVVTWIDCT